MAPPTRGPQYTSPSFSPTPMMRPPTMAPGTEVKPPRMSTGSDLSAISERLNCTPLLAPHMIPATRATRPATDQTTTQMVLSGMPMLSAASWSSATARSARPTLVRWKRTARMATRTAAVTAAVSSSRLICTPRTMNDVSGMPMSSFLTLAPQAISPKPSRKKLSPMVAMNRMIGSWLTSGRRTTRSMTYASAIMVSAVSARAATTGTPRSIKPTSVRAEKSTMTPWAKLNTPDALKIRTNPSATSEYMRPAATPPKSTSTRKVTLPAMSAKGATSTARSSSNMRDSQVRVDHDLISSHEVGGSVGDLPAVVQRHDPVGDVHHHAHVVLDEGDRRAELVVDIEDEAGHVLLLLDVHAGHRLVQEQELWLGGQRPCQLHPLLEAVGQPPGGHLADGLDLQEVYDALDGGPVLQLLPLGRPPVDGVQEKVPTHLEQPAGHDVVQHGHALEERDVLEGPGDAEGGHVVGLELGPVLALEQDSSLLGVVEATDDIDQGGLPRPVGPDDRDDLAPVDVDAHVGERLDRPESHGDVVDMEQRLPPRGGCRPRFRNRLLVERHRHLGPFHVHDPHLALHVRGPAVLVGDRDLHGDARNLGVVETGDDGRIPFIDEPATELPGSRDLGVVGVQLLVQDGEALDALRWGQSVIGPTDLLVHQLVGGGVLGEIRIARVADASPLGPVPHDFRVDVDHGDHVGALVANCHGLLDVDAELELVLDVLGGEDGTVVKRRHVLDAIDDDQLPVRVEEARVARVEPAVLERGGGLLRALVVAREEPRGADEHLAPVGKLDLDAGDGR